MQQLSDFEKPDRGNEDFCLEWTIYSGRRKVSVNYQTDADELKTVVYCYRNNMNMKDWEMELKMTEYEKLLYKRVHLLNYLDIILKRCIALDETTVHEHKNFSGKICTNFSWNATIDRRWEDWFLTVTDRLNFVVYRYRDSFITQRY